MDDISVNIGELFEDVNHRNDKNKLKPNHEIQRLLAEHFQKLTGFSVPHSRFLNVCKTYVNKIKSNKGRKDISAVMADYFKKCVSFEVESVFFKLSTAPPVFD